MQIQLKSQRLEADLRKVEVKIKHNAKYIELSGSLGKIEIFLKDLLSNAQ